MGGDAMNPSNPRVLTINGGSSSIKFSVYQTNPGLERVYSGKMDRIGLDGCHLTFRADAGNRTQTRKVTVSDHKSVAYAMMEWLEEHGRLDSIAAVGHRVAHGMQRTQPECITQGLVDELRRIELIAPDHLPREIELIKAFLEHRPQQPQVACFDTEFHRTMPRVAKLMAIPRRFEAKGVHGYGFHGLSYAFLMEELGRMAGPRTDQGRVILAHLGSGASMAAVRDGKSVDTSMSFTPTSGLVMGTRSGNLDPGLAFYLAQTEQMTLPQFYEMTTHQSGLLGISGTSSDMRDLLARESNDPHAAEAIAFFCYQAKKLIGSFAAALGGLGTLVFTGGIGENSPRIRARICENVRFLGIELSEARNAANAPVISTDASRVTVRVIRTDEEIMIARATCRTLGLAPDGRPPRPCPP